MCLRISVGPIAFLDPQNKPSPLILLFTLCGNSGKAFYGFKNLSIPTEILSLKLMSVGLIGCIDLYVSGNAIAPVQTLIRFLKLKQMRTISEFS